MDYTKDSKKAYLPSARWNPPLDYYSVQQQHTEKKE